jgi:hypothetical protein
MDKKFHMVYTWFTAMHRMVVLKIYDDPHKIKGWTLWEFCMLPPSQKRQVGIAEARGNLSYL